jgi:hypothetical protein
MRSADPLPLNSRIVPPTAFATPAGLRWIGENEPPSGWDSKLVVPVRKCYRWSLHCSFLARRAVRCLIGIREPLAAGFGGVLKITLVGTRKVSGFKRARYLARKVLFSMQSGTPAVQRGSAGGLRMRRLSESASGGRSVGNGADTVRERFP